MVRCHDKLAAAGLATRMIMQIHDELLFEGPEAEVAQAAERYELTLKSLYGTPEIEPGRPFFDICLLGMGDDGALHIIAARPD